MMKNKSAAAVSTQAKKKKHTGLILIILLLILVLAGLAGYYFYERQKPQKAVRTFLEYVKQLNFDGMTSMLQSEDLSVMENTDLKDEVFSELFHNLNQKMSYEIVKTHFMLSSGTANVTARIRYLNGINLFKEASSEFARQIVSSAFSGEELGEEELRQQLSDILMEKSASMEDDYMITEITYPLVSIDNVWKIVTLNQETINVMSANFQSLEEEIQESMKGASGDGAVKAVPAADENSVISLSTDKFSIHYTQFRLSTDFSGEPCILVYYDYTNNGNTPSSAMVDVSLQAYQNDAPCEAALPETTEDALDKYMSEVSPGTTVNVCQAFSIKDLSDVTLLASEGYSFGGGEMSTQILKLS